MLTELKGASERKPGFHWTSCKSGAGMEEQAGNSEKSLCYSLEAPF